MAVKSSSGNCDECQVPMSMTQEAPDTLLHPDVLAIKMEAESSTDLINRLQKLQTLQGKIFLKRPSLHILLLVCASVRLFFSFLFSVFIKLTIMINIV